MADFSQIFIYVHVRLQTNPTDVRDKTTRKNLQLRAPTKYA